MSRTIAPAPRFDLREQRRRSLQRQYSPAASGCIVSGTRLLALPLLLLFLNYDISGATPICRGELALRSALRPEKRRFFRRLDRSSNARLVAHGLQRMLPTNTSRAESLRRKCGQSKWRTSWPKAGRHGTNDADAT